MNNVLPAQYRKDVLMIVKSGYADEIQKKIKADREGFEPSKQY